MGGVEIGICLVYFSIFAGVRVLGVCVLVYARTHTQTTWVLDVSPVVGWTPEEPESQLYVDRIGVQSTFVYIYAGLRVSMIWANCFFVFNLSYVLRNVEDTFLKRQDLSKEKSS